MTEPTIPVWKDRLPSNTAFYDWIICSQCGKGFFKLHKLPMVWCEHCGGDPT